MDVLLVAFVSAAFMAVAGIAFAVGQLVTSRNRLQRRLPAAGARISEALTGASGDGIGALVARAFYRRSVWHWPGIQAGAEIEIGARGVF